MGRSNPLAGIKTRRNRDGSLSYRGTAYVHGVRRYGQWTRDLEQAQLWRLTTMQNARTGMLVGESLTLREAINGFTHGIEEGTIPNRSGRPYKPSVIRDYKRDLKRVDQLLGPRKLDELRLPDINRAMQLLRAKGVRDSTVHNTFVGALRALYSRWALPLGLAAVNPCIGLNCPITDERKRERIATREQCALLVAALALPDRTAFALACYAGLRGGEIFALDWSRVDLELGVVRVDRSWDARAAAFVPPKTDAANRIVPIRQLLRVVLEDHADQLGVDGLLFPTRRRSRKIARPHPMSYSGFSKRIQGRWANVGLEPLGMHEGRHTFASVLIDAMVRQKGGVNVKALTTYMGHASVQITIDRYGHLFPGNEAEVRDLLDTYDGELR